MKSLEMNKNQQLNNCTQPIDTMETTKKNITKMKQVQKLKASCEINK